ncbi:MAG TPA: 2-C-methyl-D-erythritol 4-phosphate cytidylyltransferase [Bacteroidia bacterium]|nr:2-C-methyl-D-erythritol 4-phosphate cytidylyltransferase [Bacteroidia bacterium]
MKKYAIIVAGGAGTRMGTETPKQFLELKGKPVLMHSMNRFFNFDKNITLIIVLPEHQINFWKNLCEQHHYQVPHQIVTGGSERFYSVKNGLTLVEENAIVAIHDAVRPLVSSATISGAFDAAFQYGNGIPAIPLSDSIRKIDENKNFAVNRKHYQIIQTPQCFASTTLLKAFKQEYKKEFTDDATVLESIGETIYLTQGNAENIKITTPSDLKLASALFDSIN